MSEVGIVGAGAWGTALALHAVRAGHRVTLQARTPWLAGQDSPRLPGIRLPESIVVSGSWPVRSDCLIIAVPTQHLRATLVCLAPAVPILLACKGLESGSLMLPLEVAAEVCPGVSAAVLTGPNFAREVALGLPAASVVAGADRATRHLFTSLLATPTLRLYGNDDPVGAQVGGAAKNVIAIGAGAVIGAGLGENARAALVTRGLAEIARLAEFLGGRAETVFGLSGMGDLLLTCCGRASRNFSYGERLGSGSSCLVSEDGSAVEGIATAAALVSRACGVELPLCRAVAALIAGEASVPQSLARLMERPSRDE